MGRATISADDPLIQDYREACLVVRVAIENAFTNCARYIHGYRKEAPSKYVPKPDVETPPPEWKRIDEFQDFLPEKDRDIVAKLMTPAQIADAEQLAEEWRKAHPK